MGGKVLVPTSTMIKNLKAARLASDIADVPLIILARTDANAAKNAGIPIILLEDGYTEKNTTEIYHNHLVKDFVGIENIVLKYIKD